MPTADHVPSSSEPTPERSTPEAHAPVKPGSGLDVAQRAPLHAGDRAPAFILRGQAWLQRLLPNESRAMLGMVIVVLAVVSAILLSSSRILRVFFDGLDVLALVGVFLVNWLGNGGVLVPIPGARFIGLLLVFNQAVMLPSWEVFAVAGAAMGLGLLSYYVAGQRTAESYIEGDAAGAEQLAHDTGMLDDETADFSPGAELEGRAVSAMSGVADGTAADDTGAEAAGTWPRLRRRFSTTLARAQERAQPVLERRGTSGMLLLCFGPTPLGTAAAYVGGLMGFGFRRYLLTSFAAKYLLAAIVVLLALAFSDAARAVPIPEVEIPVLDITIFSDDASAPPSVAPSVAPSGGPLG